MLSLLHNSIELAHIVRLECLYYQLLPNKIYKYEESKKAGHDVYI